MKKRLLFIAQIVLFGLFGISLLLTILSFYGESNPLSRFNNEKSYYNNVEAFDPSLARLNTLRKVEEYCDSIYAEKIFADPKMEFEKNYVEIVSNTIRNRFFHGYSYSGFSDNYVGLVASRLTVPGWSALVDPDDILKHPFAACSQQAIVMMEVLKHKQFVTRKVTFPAKAYGGHFAFEVFYDKTWHFHDPNMEPDKDVLNENGRPDVRFLAANPDVLAKAYKFYPKEKILSIFSEHTYGPINKFPAPRALIFQKGTKVLSCTIWVFFLVAFLIVRRKYLKLIRNQALYKNKPLPQVRPDATPLYYPDYTAQGA